MTFKHKALTGITVFFVAVILVITGAIAAIFKVKDSEAHFNENFARQVVLAERTRGFLEEQFSIVPSFVLNPNLEQFKRFQGAHEKLARTLTELRSELTSVQEITLLNEMVGIDQELYRAAAPGMTMRLSGKSAAQVNAYFQTQTFEKTLRLRDDMDKMVDLKVQQLETARIQLKKSFANLTSFILAGAGVLVLLCALIGMLLWRSVCQHVCENDLREKILAQQQNLSTARKEVVEVVAHDLKSPLATLLMNLELTQSDLAEDNLKFEDLAASLSMGIRSAKSMKLLIDSLLDHAKIESERLELDARLQSADDVLKQQIAQLQLLAQTKNVTVDFDIQSALPAFRYDETRLIQVVSNLISNALKFVNESGNIKFRVFETRKTVVISVFNSGTYLTKNQIEHVFERYWQVRKTAHWGTGLGLAIVKGIMLAHRGDVRVESQADAGTTFSVWFPLPENIERIAPREVNA